jgi:peroxiredoxin
MKSAWLAAVCLAVLAVPAVAQDQPTADSQTLQQEIFRHMEKLFEGDGTALQPMLKSIDTFLGSEEPGPAQLRLAMFSTRILEAAGEYKASQELMLKVKNLFAKTKDEDLIDAANAYYDELTKKYAILGKTVKLEGKLLDGKPIDWASYQGKVVLLDFWATWCKPCVEELPNLQKVYEDYHKHGFEILGISADEDLKSLNTFLHQRQLPWSNVGGTDAEKLMEQYSVDVFPTTFLVGRDGKVAFINLRGVWLKNRLAELMPEAAKAIKDAEKSGE